MLLGPISSFANDYGDPSILSLLSRYRRFNIYKPCTYVSSMEIDLHHEDWLGDMQIMREAIGSMQGSHEESIGHIVCKKLLNNSIRRKALALCRDNPTSYRECVNNLRSNLSSLNV